MSKNTIDFINMLFRLDNSNLSSIQLQVLASSASKDNS